MDLCSVSCLPIYSFMERGAMSLVKKEIQKSVRVVLPVKMYNRLKDECPEHGDLSRLVRVLLNRHLKALEEGDTTAEQIAAGRG